MTASPVALGMTAGLLLLGGGALAAADTSKPPLPYYDKGACPFECCTYRGWTTNAPVDARAEPNPKAKPVFHLDKNTPVTGVTGVVITDRYGVTRLTQPAKIGEGYTPKRRTVSLRPGDELYTLHYGGEGAVFFWHQGQTYEEILDEDAVRTVSQPRYVWWVQIRTRDGRIGWTDQTKRFDHMDSCE
jgi:hypothetical protein